MSDNNKKRAHMVKAIRASLRVKVEKPIKFTLRLPRPIWETVNLAALKKDLSMQQVIVQAVKEYSDKFLAEFEALGKDAFATRWTEKKGGK
jgi:hypothetical protein